MTVKIRKLYSSSLVECPALQVCQTGSSPSVLMTEISMMRLDGKYSLESTDPRESKIHALRQLTIALKLSYYLFIIAKLFKVKDGCLKCVYIGRNPRFTAFLDSNLHTRLGIITENGLAFPSRNLPRKFRPDPSTFYLLIVVTNKQTDRRTDKPTPVIT